MSRLRLLTTQVLTPLVAVLALVAIAPHVQAHGPESHVTVKPLLQQPLPNVEGKTFTVARVEFGPGVTSTPHRHGQAFVFAYVAKGAVRSQLEGGEAKTYETGESWTEQPGAHHILTQNASKTEPAVLIVTFVAPKGEPIKIDDPQP